MSIYTKTGDKGETSLFGGKRVSKADIQVEAYGSADELSSLIGMITTKKLDKTDHELLLKTQENLYKIMAFLAGANSPIVGIAEQINLFEQKIDKIESLLPKLHRFILPGGTEISAWFHLARTLCRRVERTVVLLSKNSSKRTALDENSLALSIKYFNRLSDLFFDMARWYNKEHEIIT